MTTVTRPRTTGPTLRGLARTMLALAMAVAIMPLVDAVPAAAASSKACRVTNRDSGKSYTQLRPAVRAAKRGHLLVVKGTCRGGTFIGKNLTIKGVKGRRTGTPILDGKRKDRVLVIKRGVKVSVRGLTVRNGRAKRVPTGGGIANKGRLTLRDVVVRDSKARSRGGGIHNEGTLRIEGRSRVLRNTKHGIWNEGTLTLAGDTRVRRNGTGVGNRGTLVMEDDANIGANGSGDDYANSVWNGGSATMNGSSSVSDHRGGSAVFNTGTLTMNGSASIHDNVNGGKKAASNGGGVFNNAGTIILNDSASIHDNAVETAPGTGGGVANAGGTVIMNDRSSIYENRARPGSGSGFGGGVWNDGGTAGAGTLQMRDSATIYGNAASQGGGVWSSATLVGVGCGSQTLANVYGNTPNDCYQE